MQPNFGEEAIIAAEATAVIPELPTAAEAPMVAIVIKYIKLILY